MNGCNLNYTDLMAPCPNKGGKMGGTKQYLHYARHDDFETFGVPEEAANGTADQYVIKTAHKLKTGARFYQLYVTMDTSELEYALNGETDGKSFKPQLKFVHPGLYKEVITFMNNSKNDQFIFIVTLTNGMKLQLGVEGLPVTVSPAPKIGKVSGSIRNEFVVEGYQPDIIIYEAAIPLTPAV